MHGQVKNVKSRALKIVELQVWHWEYATQVRHFGLQEAQILFPLS